MKTTTYEVQEDGKVLEIVTITTVSKRLLTPEEFQALKDVKAAKVASDAAAAEDDLVQIDAAINLSQQNANKIKPSPVQLNEVTQ